MISPERVDHHLSELAKTFDAAAAVAKTPFFFSTDITPAARPIAIDGSRELIHAGALHRRPPPPRRRRHPVLAQALGDHRRDSVRQPWNLVTITGGQEP
jgi:hypothetical protein